MTGILAYTANQPASYVTGAHSPSSSILLLVGRICHRAIDDEKTDKDHEYRQKGLKGIDTVPLDVSVSSEQ